ncbi:MAG TPA: hypothetical protein VGF79_08875, partial [Bacteroidia bacterium]
EEISIVDLNAFESTVKIYEDERITWPVPVKTKSLINFCDLMIELLINNNFEKKGFYVFVDHEDGNSIDKII